MWIFSDATLQLRSNNSEDGKILGQSRRCKRFETEQKITVPELLIIAYGEAYRAMHRRGD